MNEIAESFEDWAAALPAESLSAGLDRILQAAGQKYVPADLDKYALWNSLEWSATWFDVATQLGSHKSAKDRARRRKLAQIEKAAEQMMRLLSDNVERDPILAGAQRVVVDALRELRLSVPAARVPTGQRHAGGEAHSKGSHDRLRRFDQFTVSPLFSGEASAFEWLVSKCLPRLFETHFKRRAGQSANGPYIRFAEQVLIEFNIKHRGRAYTRGAIETALKFARHGEPPRRRQGRRKRKGAPGRRRNSALVADTGQT
jgi:hypothetical protein